MYVPLIGNMESQGFDQINSLFSVSLGQKHILVSHFGHLALVWAKLVLGRFRDAVLPC